MPVYLLLALSFFSQPPRVALMGGGEDLDDAFRWLCGQTRDGDFLVLRATGGDAYNAYVRPLCPAMRSVQTLVIGSREKAAEPAVAEAIRQAKVLFIAGGSQDNYINYWQGTPVQAEVNAAIARGIPIGGTSAGLAVLAEYNFSALKDTVLSVDALRNPFDARVTLGRGFLKIPHLQGLITDSHFVARDRMGRTLVFLARMAGDIKKPRAIAVDERTAVLMESDGTARVTGQGKAYFLEAPGTPERTVPLTYRDVRVYRIGAGAGAGAFDVAHWTGRGGVSYRISAEAGSLHSTLPDGKVY